MPITIEAAQFQNLAVTEQDDGVWIVTLNRPAKRNALDIDTIEELVRFFTDAPLVLGVRGGVLAGGGRLISAPVSTWIEHHACRPQPGPISCMSALRWHEAFNKMEYGASAVIAALQVPWRRARTGPGLGQRTLRVMHPTRLFALARRVRRGACSRGERRDDPCHRPCTASGGH